MENVQRTEETGKVKGKESPVLLMPGRSVDRRKKVTKYNLSTLNEIIVRRVFRFIRIMPTTNVQSIVFKDNPQSSV